MIDADPQFVRQQPRSIARPAPQYSARRLQAVLLLGALLAGAGLLLWLGQPTGAALLPFTGVLVAALIRRDRRARELAQRIAAGQLDEKIEVRPGALGELDRAVNGLLQAQRVEQRLRSVLPAPLPAEAVQALLSGQLATHSESRMVAILLASFAGHHPGDRKQPGALELWRALAQMAQQQAQHHGALLQPCGDAVMLVFGAFGDQPATESLRAALAAGEQLRQGCRSGRQLVISMALGTATAAALPGLGYCVLGAPVVEARQLQHQALQSRQFGLVCGEGVFYALRQNTAAEWQPTNLRIPGPIRGEQVVYLRAEATPIH